MRPRRSVAIVCWLAIAAASGSSCRREPGTPPDPTVWGKAKGKSTPIVMNRAKPDQGEPAAVLDILGAELEHNLEQLSDEALEAPAYYLGYDLVSSSELWILAEDGALVRDEFDVERAIDVDVRVGSRELDNSHSVDGDYGPGNGLGSGLPVSVDDDPLSLAQSLWLDTESQYHAAVASLREIESDEQMRAVMEGAEHPDFSAPRPHEHIEPERSFDFESVRPKFREMATAVSESLGDDPLVLQSNVSVGAALQNHYLVTSEGSRVQTGTLRFRVLLEARTQAEDGMVLERTATYEAHRAEQLPDQETLVAEAERLRTELLALREAPVAQPYTGPAILEGRAAGVFFHEIFGHRLEGHRQKDHLEGQTFTDRLGKRVLPTFLDVVDDPTVTTLGGQPLSGHYFVDDEGIPAQRTVLVDRGKLQGFLLSRSVVLPFEQSNGHGRREPGYQTVARQGNLIVTSRKSMTHRELRAELIREVERQNKPYGLLFRDIEGGYTLTDRSGPQAFKVQPLMVYRVYPDGRPDELVRGVEIVGTPLAAFETIIATDDEPGIFNGMCGAESGWVPVSAVSPSLLLRSLEIERTMNEREKPPLLDPPKTALRQRGGRT